MRYRRKLVEVEAVQLPNRQGDFTNAPRWFLDAFVFADPLTSGQVFWVSDRDLAVATPNGIMHGKPGDYIIRLTEPMKGDYLKIDPDKELKELRAENKRLRADIAAMARRIRRYDPLYHSEEHERSVAFQEAGYEEGE